MKFDYFIEKVDFKFETQGSCKIELYFNGEPVSDFSITKNIKRSNTVEIKFTKDDPSDVKAYCTLKKVLINGFDCVDRFKHLKYKIDTRKHKVQQDTIPNNLYFGYVGNMIFTFEHKNDLLSQAAWSIADKRFEKVKWPTRNENYRIKDFKNVYDEFRFMFTGCHPPPIREIDDIVNNLKIDSLTAPMRLPYDKLRVENWINQSNRVNIKNFRSLPYFTISTGTTESIYSFLTRFKKVYMPQKAWHHNRQILDDKDIEVGDLFSEILEEDSAVLIELPAPWYNDNELIDVIKRAKKKYNCYIALDLSWLSVCMNNIDIDLDYVDEIFFSMNKCWPITSLRPAMRWSRHRINDSQTFDSEVSIYPKVPINVLLKLIDVFPFDYTFDKYKYNHKKICNVFSLRPTPVLWFTTHNDVAHNEDTAESHFFLDDFVCVVKLLQHKGSFFW